MYSNFAKLHIHRTRRMMMMIIIIIIPGFGLRKSSAFSIPSYKINIIWTEYWKPSSPSPQPWPRQVHVMRLQTWRSLQAGRQADTLHIGTWPWVMQLVKKFPVTTKHEGSSPLKLILCSKHTELWPSTELYGTAYTYPELLTKAFL
jgi:hypothetical protein